MSKRDSNRGSFYTYKPKALALQKYIAYYYFHTKEDAGPLQFTFYPHIRNGLTIYKGSETEHTLDTSTTRPDATRDYKFLYSGITTESIQVIIHPPFYKVGIAFKPLGINNFISSPLSQLMSNTLDFDYFKPTMKAALDKLYAEKAIPAKAAILDHYFLEQYQQFPEARLIKAITTLTDSDKKHTVQSLADYTNTSRKTLLRLFKTHLNCTVKDFLHVVQFRKAIELYQSAQNKPQLGEVAMRTDYYDQSDFIKHFKKITGFNPKKFFSGIEHIGSEDTFWTFKS